MDNLTHSLTGLALSRAGLDRYCPRAVWLLILSANAPDADIIFAQRGAFSYLEHHRGYTHSFVGLPLMAALTVVVIALLFRQRLPWFRAWLLCVIGVASHLLLDWTNSYGLRPLIPFSSSWFHLDINALYDDWILVVLSFAALWPFFVRLINREIGVRHQPGGRGAAIFALTFFLLFDVGRLILHNQVVNEVEARLYDDAPPLQTAALPNAIDPLRWMVIVETAVSYRIWNTSLFSPFDTTGAATFYKPPVTASLVAVTPEDPFRFFLYFARFPVWSEEKVEGEHSRSTRFDLTDLRFGTPGTGSFHCIASVNERHQVTGKWFTYGSGADLGREADSANRHQPQ